MPRDWLARLSVVARVVLLLLWLEVLSWFRARLLIVCRPVFHWLSPEIARSVADVVGRNKRVEEGASRRDGDRRLVTC
jgi:hypothetical protein